MAEKMSTPRKEIITMLQKPAVMEQLAMALPKYYTPEQFLVIFRTAINKNPKLLECTPESFMIALLTAAQMGLAPDGRQGHLIPRWNSKTKQLDVAFQDDYKGIVSLVRRQENVSDIYAEIVRENDVFKIIKGLHRDLIHEIDIRADRGKMIGAYAVIAYTDGKSSFEFMSKEEIELVRDNYSESWKAHKDKGFPTGWISSEGEFWKKTVIRRLLKLADLQLEIADRVHVNPDVDFDRPELIESSEPEQIQTVERLLE